MKNTGFFHFACRFWTGAFTNRCLPYCFLPPPPPSVFWRRASRPIKNRRFWPKNATPPPGKPVTFYECHPEDHAPAPSVRADFGCSSSTPAFYHLLTSFYRFRDSFSCTSNYEPLARTAVMELVRALGNLIHGGFMRCLRRVGSGNLGSLKALLSRLGPSLFWPIRMNEVLRRSTGKDRLERRFLDDLNFPVSILKLINEPEQILAVSSWCATYYASLSLKQNFELLSSELLWAERSCTSCTNIPIRHGSELNTVTVTLWRCWVRFTFHIVSLSDSVRSPWIRPTHRSSALEALEALEESHGRCGDVLRSSGDVPCLSQSYFQAE